MELDKLDRDILNILQQDATLPLKELAEKVHSSVATCQRRIQLLIEKGVITKQVAVVSPKSVGRGISVFVIGYPVYDESPEIMRQIWCETDNKKRQMLLDSAMKNSNTIKNTHCKTTHNPLAQSQKTAQALAIMATPAIFREDGVLFEGDFRDDEFFKFLGL